MLKEFRIDKIYIIYIIGIKKTTASIARLSFCLFEHTDLGYY